MDIKGPSKPEAPKPPRIPSKISNLTGDQLRTMRRDIEMLKKGERPTKTIVPPKNLPIVEPKISQEAEKEATRQAFGEVMKEVKDISRKNEEPLAPIEEKEPVVHPSEKSSLFSQEKPTSRPPLFPPEKDSKPADIPATTPKPITPIRPPVKPLEPVKKPLEELKKEVPTPPPAKSKKGLFIALAVIVIVALLGGGGAYWWFYMRKPATHMVCQNFQCVTMEGEGESSCMMDTDCLPPEPEVPVSLISVDQTETIEVITGQEADFLNDLRTVANRGEEESIRRILVKKISTTEANYASLTELSDLMGITIPLALKSSFGNSYTLFVYVPGTEESGLCQTSGNLGCSGPRLGLVISLADKTTAVGELVKWEETILDDLESFIMAETTGDTIFQYSTIEDLKGASFVRYANLPISPIAIDYGIKDDLLIIGTSKNSFFKALELIP